MGSIIEFAPRQNTGAEMAYAQIHCALTARREGLVSEYEANKYGSQFEAYAEQVDSALYSVLGQFRGVNQEAFSRAKNELDAETTFHLQTHIGERLDVGLSTYKYLIKDGELQSESGIPVVSMIDRGRRARNAQALQQLQEGKISPERAAGLIERHDAEVAEFTRIRDTLVKSDTIGTVMIAISPPGPGYSSNFYDVFTLCRASDGTKYIEAKRYTSTLDPEKSLSKAQQLQHGYGRDRGQAALVPYFLKNPILVDNPLHPLFGNPDRVHEFMTGDANAMTEADFVLVKEVLASMISIYLAQVFEHPEDIARQGEILDAIRNKADDAKEHIAELRSKKAATRRDTFAPVASVLPFENRIDALKMSQAMYAAALADINHFGALPVRTAAVPCGESGSSQKQNGLKGLAGLTIPGMNGIELPGNLSPFSMADEIMNEDNPDGKGPLEFQCDKCPGKHKRPLGTVLKECPVTGEAYTPC